MAGGRGRECFLRGVAACYAIAFASFYVQYDGLLGHAGLLPVDQFLRAASREADERAWARLARVPTVSWYSDALGCSVDELNRATALLGALLSSLIAASALAPSGVALAALVLLYLSLVSIGQTFFAFQWDTLLIEAGAVAAVYAAPLGGAARLDDGFAPGAWAARFLLFKLMLMAGMVKVQSECTTWLNLTALEFHFATQCLPTPLAWFAHSLPPPLLRLAVGATLLIEIPAAFLLLAPHAAARRVGVACQLLLQLPIALTGNYNWFNLLTALLTVPCWDVAAHPRPHRAAAEPPAPLRLAGWRDGGAAWRSLAVLWLAWSASRLFTLGWWASDEVRGADASAERWWARLTIALALSRADLDALVGAALRGGAALFALGLVVSSALHVRAAVASAPARRRARVQRGVSAACSCALALGLVAASSVPLRAIAPVLRAPAPFLALHSRVSALRLVLRAPAPFVALHSRVSALRLVSGYGLFRRMTGVAQRQGSASTTAQSRAGWGGQPPSAVARPELIIEVSRDHGSSWAAVEFRQLIIEFSRSWQLVGGRRISSQAGRHAAAAVVRRAAPAAARLADVVRRARLGAPEPVAPSADGSARRRAWRGPRPPRRVGLRRARAAADARARHALPVRFYADAVRLGAAPAGDRDLRRVGRTRGVVDAHARARVRWRF
jgi:hypothetical protein